MRHLLIAASLWPLPLFAQDAPKVVTDIAPIHSLVASVMGDAGTPDLLLPPGADPHHYALRASDAHKLAEADVVIWAGPSLTPWLEEPIATLAPNARVLTLLDTEGWEAIEVAEDDDHDHGHTHKGHDHGPIDPHAWLDPVAAQAWVTAMARTLSAMDETGAYPANADRLRADLAGIEEEARARLQLVQGRPYIIAHDGYAYFEARFGLGHVDAISGLDAQDPGPAHIADLRTQMTDSNVACVFGDAEIGGKWVDLVTEGTSARTAQLNPVGAGLTPGPALYSDMMGNLVDAFESCLADAAG